MVLIQDILIYFIFTSINRINEIISRFILSFQSC